MKIVEPSFKILTVFDGDDNTLKDIERAGRTCYKSEDKITDTSAREFIKMLISRGHESVLEHRSVSVRFVCDRGVSHELVRHRIASFSQESTRYCNYASERFGKEITVILPPGIAANGSAYIAWAHAVLEAERNYFVLLDMGYSPQIARSVLPNALKTEIVVTANLREWRTIFNQRCAPAAHPQMRELMLPLLDEMKRLIPVVFDDINYE